MKKSTFLLILVASLGYFVDAFDLILFSVLGKNSLSELGYTDIVKRDQMVLLLFNIQMIGMLVGGVFFGVMGDKKGRLSVLFGSIIIYSLANLLNGFVYDIYSYGVLRFISGFGLAGELGVGVTLVAESMPQKYRGYGTSIMAAIGVLGAVTAGIVGDLMYWRYAFYIGGGLGLLLLFLRVGTFESDIFKSAEESSHNRGDFLSLFKNPTRLKKYLYCMLIGFPVFFIVTILMQLAPTLAGKLEVQGVVSTGKAVTFIYSGLAIGDVFCGFVSQKLKSRKKAIAIFQVFSFCMSLIYLNLYQATLFQFFTICVIMGISTGYWIVLITMSAEQFGTDLRATVATTIPNFARGAAVPISMLYTFLNSSITNNVLHAAMIVGIVCFTLAIYANYKLKDTFHRDLNFLEE
jgi:MFS transporter, putative metabolite:H+ symporter